MFVYGSGINGNDDEIRDLGSGVAVGYPFAWPGRCGLGRGEEGKLGSDEMK